MNDHAHPKNVGLTLAQLFQVRRLLEPQAASLAASRVTSRTLEELGGLLRQEEEMLRLPELDRATLLHIDQRFHGTINRASGNTFLAALAEGIYEGTTGTRAWWDIAERETFQRSVAEHRAILAALRLRDPSRARVTTETHLVEIEERIRALLTAPRHAIPSR
jgi:GntR family transcriptional regulator, transcriptional repressor for pyruvate dehydrogenase complex